MNTEKAFDEFVKYAKESFIGVWPNLSEKEVEDYFGKAKKYLRSRFESDLEKFKKGEINERQLIEGGGNSAGWCMGYCYDDPMDE